MTRDVLEENVRRLLRHSYVPALPAPGFRDRLEGLVVAEVGRRVQRKRATLERGGPGARLEPGGPRAALERGAPGARWRVAGVAVAAVALAALGAWRYFGGEAAPTRARLLAQGEVALGLADGSWRAADEEERVHGLQVAALPLTAVTPLDVEFDLLVAQGRVHLEARSELLLAGAGQDVTATLLAGAAEFVRREERLGLVPGAPLALAELPERATPEPITAGPGAREPAPVATAEPVRAPEPPAGRALTGRVLAAADGAPIPAFTVGLLAERRGNSTPPPATRAFAAEDGRFRWADPPAGKQRVFVHAEGFALRALGEYELTGEPPELTVELEPGVGVRGFVLDEHQNPVPDALIVSEHETPTDGLMLAHSELAFWLPIQARSAADGSFELAHLSPGLHTLRASAAGHATSWRTDVRVPAEPGTELLLTLGPGGAIAGSVLRADGGPWAGAELVAVTMDQVERARTNFAHTRTDAEGRYRFEHVPVTTMIVVLLRSDEQPDVRPVQVVEEQTVTADFDSAPRGTRLFGRLLDRAGQPLPQRNIGLFDAETASWSQDWVAGTTRADGGYVFERVEPGRYELFLIDDVGRGLLRVDSLELPAGAPELEHDVRVSDSSLEVTLRTADGTPVELTSVIVTQVEPGVRERFAGYVSSDAAGRCSFPGLLPGTYRVVGYPVRADLGYVTSELVRVEPARTVALGLVHEPGGMVTVVVRARDGRPLQGAAVVFHDAQGVQHIFSRVPTTDSAGRYQAFGLRPGGYRVEALLDGWHCPPVRFQLELGRELEIPVVLAPR